MLTAERFCDQQFVVAVVVSVGVLVPPNISVARQRRCARRYLAGAKFVSLIPVSKRG